MSFSDLGLKAELLRAVSAQGYTEPTPVQRQAIPYILEGCDLLAGAQTGTGKTAAFALPLLQKLSAQMPARGWRPVRALILSPTRELAAQVREDFGIYGKHLPVRSTAVFGGVNIRPQIQNLQRGVDILVATPGRLIDHLDQRTLTLESVEVLVLDEADRMLDMGFLPSIRRIMAALPGKRQNLLFSATYSKEIRALAAQILRNPKQVQIARDSSAAESVAQTVHPVDKARKRELLGHLIESNDWRQVLVFTRMKHGAEKLAKQLAHSGLQAGAIHGNKSQQQRTRALRDFKSGALRILVATDVASRGLDIEQLPHVVNYELPADVESYVHRIGRTGRAGLTGVAVSLVAAEEFGLLGDIERFIRREIPRVVIPGFEPQSRVPNAGMPHTQRRSGRRSGGGPRRSRPAA
jgi:ATP-dependent RNA helicase RhlE